MRRLVLYSLLTYLFCRKYYKMLMMQELQRWSSSLMSDHMANTTCYILHWQSSRDQHCWHTIMQCLLMKTGLIYRNWNEVTNALIHSKLESLELDSTQFFMLQVCIKNTSIRKILYLFVYHFYTYKYKKKLVILQSIRVIVIKSKETRLITYTCRYSSGHLIPNSVVVCFPFLKDHNN